MAWTDDVRPGKAAASAVGGAGAGYLLNKYLLGNDTTGSSILASALGAALGGGSSMLYDYFAGPSVSGSTEDVDKWNKYKRYARAYLGDREPDKDAKLKLSGKDLDKAMRELKRDVDSPTANNLLRAGAWAFGIPAATRLATEAASLYIPRDLDTIAIKGSGKSIPVKTRGKMARYLFGAPTERTVDLAGVSDRGKMTLLRDIARGEQRITITPNQRKEFIDAVQNLDNAGLADEAYNRRMARYDRAAAALESRNLRNAERRAAAGRLSDEIQNRRTARYDRALTELESRKLRNSAKMAEARRIFDERHAKWQAQYDKAVDDLQQQYRDRVADVMEIRKKLKPEDQHLIKMPDPNLYKRPVGLPDEPLWKDYEPQVMDKATAAKLTRDQRIASDALERTDIKFHSPRRLKVKPENLERTITLTKPSRLAVTGAQRRTFNELMSDLGRGANKMTKFRRLTLPRALGIVNGLSLLAGLGAAGAEHLNRRQRLSELASGVMNR